MNMIGWIVAALIWAAGVRPTFQTLSEEYEEEFGDPIENAEVKHKIATVAAVAMWPILFFIAELADRFGVSRENNNE